MLVSEYAVVNWNSRNKKKYESLGYTYTGKGTPVNISIKDLPPYSQSKITARCDYCGELYETTWSNYNRGLKSLAHKDSCGNIECLEKKALEAQIAKYGDLAIRTPEIREKQAQTNIIKYGSVNPFGSEIIKEKIVSSNMMKYGVPYTQQSPDVRAKTEATCLERYGVKNYVELFKGQFIKENSPVWKGGVEYTRDERSSYEYGQWRSSVFARDHYTCCKCGCRNGNGKQIKLHAHHIYNWKDNEDSRYDIDNGITLCVDCHMKFHSKYGKRNNTPEQLYEFLELDEKIC